MLLGTWHLGRKRIQSRRYASRTQGPIGWLEGGIGGGASGTEDSEPDAVYGYLGLDPGGGGSAACAHDLFPGIGLDSGSHMLGAGGMVRLQSL